MPSIDVSVIIPCYRCADTIHRAVNSVLQQTRSPRELFLVDDCSDDNDATLGVLRTIENNNPQLPSTVISLLKNGGPGIARNAAWENAAGEFITFLDADDAWHPQKLEIQHKWLVEHPQVVICGHLSEFSQKPEPIFVHLDYCDIKSENISFSEMQFSNRLPTRSVMLRRSITLRFGSGRNAEDYLLWMQIIAAGFRATLLKAPLAYSFRPEFSPGGLSGELWTHEKGELKALHQLHRDQLIGLISFVVVSGWSILKFIKRLLFRVLKSNRFI
jgi:glycosyltransferase involved in cell wall biosynthesis